MKVLLLLLPLSPFPFFPYVGTGSLFPILGAFMQLSCDTMKDRGGEMGHCLGASSKAPGNSLELVGKGCSTCLNGTEVFDELFRSG